MNFLEHIAVQLVELAQALQRVIEARQRAVSLIPRDRHAREADERRLALSPGLDQWIHRVAMRAGIPEELQDFDLPGGHLSGLCRHDPRVVGPLLPRRWSGPL